MLGVPIVDVGDGGDEGDPEGEEEEAHQGDREEPEVPPVAHAEHGEEGEKETHLDREVHAVGKDGADGENRAEEVDLPDQVPVHHQALRSRVHGHVQEVPGKEPHEQEGGEAADAARADRGLDLEEHAEHDREDGHGEEGIEERPEDAEGRALVRRAQLAEHQVPQEVNAADGLRERARTAAFRRDRAGPAGGRPRVRARFRSLHRFHHTRRGWMGDQAPRHLAPS